MSTPVVAFKSFEKAVMALLVRDYPPLTGLDTRIGGEMPGTVDQWYIRIDRVGGGRADSFGGTVPLDIEVFSTDYLNADQIASDIEAIMLAHGYHVVLSEGLRWVFDDIFQTSGVNDLPWDGDDDTYRLGATYLVTSRRRPGGGGAIPAPPAPELGGTAYDHHQTSADTTWTIVHNLGYRPGGVRVSADNGDTYYPVVVDLDDNTVRLTLAEAITGHAYLS